MGSLIWLVAACTTPEQKIVEAEEQVLATMGEHWDELERMRDAAAFGKLDEVHALAESFEKRMPVKGLPKDLEPMQGALNAGIAAARKATTAEEAGLAVGQMAAACGTCHTLAKVQPTLEVKLATSSNADVPTAMIQHQLAAANLWAAIVRHDEVEFGTALDALEKASWRPEGGTAMTAAMEEHEKRVQQLAFDSVGAVGLEAKGKALGQILGSCAGCHALVNVQAPK